MLYDLETREFLILLAIAAVLLWNWRQPRNRHKRRLRRWRHQRELQELKDRGYDY